MIDLIHLPGAPCVPDFPQLNATNGEMEECTRVKSFDYFSGSEAAYILTVFFILGSIIRKQLAVCLTQSKHAGFASK